MNHSYYDDGDSIIVTNEKGEMIIRDNHENIVEELQLENYLENCNKYNNELQKKINDLKEERKDKLKKISGCLIIGGASCFIFPPLFFLVNGIGNFINASFGISAISFAWLGIGLSCSLLTSVPSRKKISSLEKKLKFSQDMFSELENEAKKQIEAQKYISQDKVFSQPPKREIHEVFPNQQLEDVNTVFHFIDYTTMSNSVLRDMAISGSLTERLYTHGYTLKQAELLTKYYSNMAMPESTLIKKFSKNKSK